jgi:hypothetical protein
MRIKAIACEALTRELRLASANSPHLIDIELLDFGLHCTPDNLRETIQASIDAAEGKGYDAIILGYGLCSRGTAEITSRSIPLIVPRMHDCITALLGSRARYDEEFASNPGTYYYSPGWIERKEGDIKQGLIDDVQTRGYEERYQQYVEKYGEDNAKFLIEQEQQWYANYTRAAFINMGLGDIEAYRKFTGDLAKDRGWKFAEIEGDLSLVIQLTNGQWDSDQFLRVEPGQIVAESFDELVLKIS